MKQFLICRSFSFLFSTWHHLNGFRFVWTDEKRIVKSSCFCGRCFDNFLETFVKSSISAFIVFLRFEGCLLRWPREWERETLELAESCREAEEAWWGRLASFLVNKLRNKVIRKIWLSHLRSSTYIVRNSNHHHHELGSLMHSPCCQALHVSHWTRNSPASGSSSISAWEKIR